MKLVLSTLFIILFSSVAVYSCECPEFQSLRALDEASFEWSEAIVIGKLKKIGSLNQILISEALLGDVKGEELIQLAQPDSSICPFFPNQEGVYLFYLKSVNIEKKIYYWASSCLGTRMLNHENFPVSLRSNKAKNALIKETEEWVSALRKKRNENGN
ncbi:MAG: hypothetical protein NXI08_10665 [bacterium]|nr:hypothetical protein [bacterium]